MTIFTVFFIDKPGPPEGPLNVIKVDKDSVTISWKPPTDDGGSDIISYSIEKCDIKRKVWMKVASIESDTLQYCIPGLIEGSEYSFRVHAENISGMSTPLESLEPVLAKCPYGRLVIDMLVYLINFKLYQLKYFLGYGYSDIPSAPLGPFHVTGMNDTSFTLKWNSPENDGGTPITGYVIEKRETGKKAWQNVGTTDGKTLHFEVHSLKPEVPYNFRVSARNEIGTGPPYAPEETITPGKKISKFNLNSLLS